MATIHYNINHCRGAQEGVGWDTLAYIEMIAGCVASQFAGGLFRYEMNFGHLT